MKILELLKEIFILKVMFCHISSTSSVLNNTEKKEVHLRVRLMVSQTSPSRAAFLGKQNKEKYDVKQHYDGYIG